MGSYEQMMLVDSDLRASDVDGEWFAPVCTVEHIKQLDDGVHLRPGGLNKDNQNDEVRQAAEIAFEHRPDIDFFIHTYTQNTVMASSARMYERWDEFDTERVELVIEMSTGENNWQEPFRYFSNVHGITVETVDPDWPPSGSGQTYYNMTAGERDRR
ncbi:hypothetical protein [Halobaculum litoreum]|uniref:hypothetical protein n=1 Tax=Halobaculum litoreum TaxID=3031998 RepID=UPI0024C3F955|nr:hypothetical protein [Halobaculum sp. DT92]